MGNPKGRDESSDSLLRCHSHEKDCHIAFDITVNTTVVNFKKLWTNAQEQINCLKVYRRPDRTNYIGEMMSLSLALAPEFQRLRDQVKVEESGQLYIKDNAVYLQNNTGAQEKVYRLRDILPAAKEQINNLIEYRCCYETMHIRSMMALLIGISAVNKGEKSVQRLLVDTNTHTQRRTTSEQTKLQNKKKEPKAGFKTYEENLPDLLQEVKRCRHEIVAKEEQIQQLHQWFLQTQREKYDLAEEISKLELEKENDKKEKENFIEQISELTHSIATRDKQLETLKPELQRQKDYDKRFPEGVDNFLKRLQDENKDLKNQLFHEQFKYKALSDKYFDIKTVLRETNKIRAEIEHAESTERALNASLHLKNLAKDKDIAKLRFEKTELEDLLKKTKDITRDKDQDIKKLKTLQNDKQELQNENSQFRETINQMLQQKKRLQDMNIELQEKNDQLDQENKTLTECKRQTAIELQMSRDYLQRVTQDTKTFKSEIDSLKKEMWNSNDSITREREHFKTTESEFRCITASVKREVENKDTEIANLRHLLKANEESEQRTYQLQSETRHRHLYENIEKLEKSKEDLKHNLKCLQEENGLLCEQNKKVSKDLFDKEQNMKRNENCLKIKRSEVETLKTEVTRLTKELQAVNNEVAVQKEELKIKEKEIYRTITSNEHVVHNLQQENEKLKNSLEEKIERSKSEQNIQKVQSRDQQRQLEVKIEELKEINNKLNKEIETLRTKCEQLVDEKAHITDELTAKNQRIQSKEIELQNKYSEIEKLKADLIRQEVQVSDLNVALSYGEERLQSKEKEYAALILSTKQLNQQNQTLRENVEEEFMSKVRTLQNDWEHKQTEFEEQVSELRQNEEALKKRLKILKIQCHQLDQDKSKLTEDIMNKKLHLQKQEIDLHDLRLELAQLEKDKERLQTEVAKSKQMQNSLADELKQKESSLEQEIERMKFELTEQSKSLQLECQCLKQKYRQLEEQVAKEKGNFEKQVYEYQQRILNLDTNNKEMKLELATQRHEIQSRDRLTDRLHTLEDRIDQLTNEKGEMIKQSTERENIISRQKDTLDRLRQDNAELNEDLMNKKNTRDQMDKEYADNIVKLENALASLKQELNSVQSTNARLRNQEDQYRQQMEIYQSKNEKLVEKLQKEETSVKREKDMNVKLQDVNQKLQNKVQQLSRGDSSNSVLQQQCYDLREQLKLATKELDETKSRLSRAMGDRLTDNNPNITDLSDKNRPTKISERYQELYDNQWTDAFEVIDKDFGKEEQTIKGLKDILTEAVKFCKLEATKQIQQMTEALSKGKDVPAHIMKQLKDTRKALAERYGKELYKEYVDQLRRSKSDAAKMAFKVPLYLQECFEICWLMAVQDPPVVFGPDVLRGGVFNKDHYKAYTKGGDTVKFVVWPVLLLHESGPVLCKGVAQG